MVTAKQVGVLIAVAILSSVLTLSIRGCSDGGVNPPPKPPTPIVDDAPIKAPGFRVLVIYESADGVPDQVNGVEVRSYLDSHCEKVDGHADYRVWDQDVDLTNASRHFTEAMLRPRTSLPWILISNGKTGFAGPLPATSAQVLSKLKEFGGQ